MHANVEYYLVTGVPGTGSVVGVVVYTGSESRSAMNTSSPSTKIGQIDHELNVFIFQFCNFLDFSTVC